MSYVFKEITTERLRQEELWGEQNHTPIVWLPILMEEVGEASQAAVKAHFGDGDNKRYRAELIQVAALAVAMVESYDRNEEKP